MLVAVYDTLRTTLRSSSNSERPCNKVLWYVSWLLSNAGPLFIFFVSLPQHEEASEPALIHHIFPQLRKSRTTTLFMLLLCISTTFGITCYNPLTPLFLFCIGLFHAQTFPCSESYMERLFRHMIHFAGPSYHYHVYYQELRG